MGKILVDRHFFVEDGAMHSLNLADWRFVARQDFSAFETRRQRIFLYGRLYLPMTTEVVTTRQLKL